MSIAGVEWIILLGVVFLVLFVGGKKVPEFARGLGRATGEFKRGQMEVEKAIREDREKEGRGREVSPAEKERRQVVKAARALGIDTEGKSLKQLRREIAVKMKDGAS